MDQDGVFPGRDVFDREDLGAGRVPSLRLGGADGLAVQDDLRAGRLGGNLKAAQDAGHLELLCFLRAVRDRDGARDGGMARQLHAKLVRSGHDGGEGDGRLPLIVVVEEDARLLGRRDDVQARRERLERERKGLPLAGRQA